MAIEANIIYFLLKIEDKVYINSPLLVELYGAHHHRHQHRLGRRTRVEFLVVVENVPFKRNRQTILRGKVFTAGTSGAAFTLETAWLEDKTVDF